MSVTVPPKGTRGVPFPRFVVASRHPDWLRNLAKQPQATIEFYGGRRVEVEARTLAGPELDAAWKRLAEEAPEYPKYHDKTDREIPVLRLQRRRGELQNA
jgi:deazaflavin-dependent oxidoreductase (nitroreductase family)